MLDEVHARFASPSPGESDSSARSGRRSYLEVAHGLGTDVSSSGCVFDTLGRVVQCALLLSNYTLGIL